MNLSIEILGFVKRDRTAVLWLNCSKKSDVTVRKIISDMLNITLVDFLLRLYEL